ncbi:MAG TPA: SAM-dependent chlorinase/fluorinase [Pyrinomonadaceae bacterium]
MIVTLLTDFGTADYFVGALKGAVLAANPSARVVDITHEVPPYDVEAGAFTLRAAFETFPEGTVHVAVVDPGVGSARRGVALAGRGHTFVGPDNGLFGHVYERVRPFKVFHLTNESFFRREVSATFHGRDIFAPVAGALSRGVRAEELGPEVEDFVRLPSAAPVRLEGGTLAGSVIHIDRFGNCITNITPGDLTDEDIGGGARLVVCGHEISSFRHFFAEDGGATGEPFAVWGSAGLLEIAVFRDSAARVLGIRRGQKVEVQTGRNRAR